MKVITRTVIDTPADYKPIPHHQFTGFYYIPNYTKYILNPTTYEVKRIWDKYTTDLTWHANARGYCHTTMTNDDGIRCTVARHRVHAAMFHRHQYPSLKGLVVNHIDGIPGNDHLENLEWCSIADNLAHARKHLLNPRYAPMAMRNIDTGEILYFEQIIDCAAHMGIHKDAIAHRLNDDESCVWPERMQYRRTHSTDPWIVPDNIEEAINRHLTTKEIAVRDLSANKVLIYKSNKEAALALGIADPTLSTWISTPNQPVFRSPALDTFIQVKQVWDGVGWREVKNPLHEYLQNNKIHRAVITTDDDGVEKFYFSSKACAHINGLLTTTLLYRLKSDGRVRFSDGLRYKYYDSSIGDLPEG